MYVSKQLSILQHELQSFHSLATYGCSAQASPCMLYSSRRESACCTKHQHRVCYTEVIVLKLSNRLPHCSAAAHAHVDAQSTCFCSTKHTHHRSCAEPEHLHAHKASAVSIPLFMPLQSIHKLGAMQAVKHLVLLCLPCHTYGSLASVTHSSQMLPLQPC